MLTEATAGSALALEGAIHPVGDPNQDLADCPVNLSGGFGVPILLFRIAV